MKYIDIENIVENKVNKHSNDYKNTIYTDKEYNIVSKELLSILYINTKDVKLLIFK